MNRGSLRLLDIIFLALVLNPVILAGKKKKEKTEKVDKKETPILLAAKNGITEMVKEILRRFPVAIQDMNSEHKNIVSLVVENRQPHIYELLLNQKIQKDTVFFTTLGFITKS